MSEYIRFFHKNTSTEIINNTNNSIKNTLDLQINLYLNTQSYLSGYIKQNTNIIGEVYKNSSSETVMFYSGFSELPVKKNDIISVEITHPITHTKSFTVNRYQPDIMPEMSYGRFLERINKYEFFQNNKKNTIDHSLNYINQPKQFKLPQNILTIKRYFHDMLPLPPMDALFFRNATDTNNALSSYIPPTMQEIFNTWYRFSHGGSGHATHSNVIPAVPSHTNEWFYNETTDQIFTTINSTSHIGFVSNEKLENYDHYATLQGATSSDNDGIGVVVAFYRDHNDMVPNNAYGLNSANFSWPINTTSTHIPNEHSIILLRCREASLTDVHGTQSQFSLIYNYKKLDATRLSDGDHLVWKTTANYNFNECDIRILRSGNTIQAWTNNWTDAPGGKGNFLGPLTINLDDNPILHKFKGPSSYGYCAHSQHDATFKNVNLVGGIDRGTIVNAATSQVYRYNRTNGQWELTTLTPQEIFGFERPITNPDTGETFLVREHDILIL